MLAILTAAEQVLSDNPAASIEQIAAAADVARTTVHRHFATRDALIDALTAWADEQFRKAVDDARPETAPPLVALYEATANVLRAKSRWPFAMNRALSTESAATTCHAEVMERCDNLFRRAQQAGLLRPDADLLWARRAYQALVEEVHRGGDAAGDVDVAATAVVDLLLHGIGTPTARL